MEARRGSTRVEQRGRFTITEIIPGSPQSPQASAFDRREEEADPSPEPEMSEEKSPPRPEQAECAPAAADDVPPASPAVVAVPADPQPSPAREEAAPPSAGSNNDVPAAVVAMAPESPVLAPQADPAVVATEPSSQDESPPPERQPQQVKRPADRRVRRKGRFTIIELASDSPTGRKASDEFDGTQPPTARFTRSFTAAPSSSKKVAADKHYYRNARSMTRTREPHVPRRARLRSESPMRASSVSMSVGSVISSRNSVGGFESQAYGARIPLLERHSSAQSMLGSSQIPSNASILSVLPQQEALAPTAAIPAHSPLPASVPVSPALSASRSNASFFANGDATRMAQQQQQQQPAAADAGQSAEAPLRGVGAMQNTITISAAQFLQQQQTIASLIRQQHDLKQIIAVLHEQQQQLMTIPMQLGELKRANTQGDARDEETRELYMQLDALSRTNESLQTLLSQTEQDANLRGLEIDCLSDENDELRRRCAQLEARYIAERKQSFILEEELQRLRMMTLNHELQERLTNTGVSEGEA